MQPTFPFHIEIPPCLPSTNI